MLERNDERLIWKYLDGELDDAESTYLLQKLKGDEALQQYLHLSSQMDKNLSIHQSYAMPEALKQKVLVRSTTSGQKNPVPLNGFSFKSLNTYILINFLLLVGSILLYLFYHERFDLAHNVQFLNDLSIIVDQPAARSFFIICICFLGLMFMDSFFKSRNRLTAI